MNKILLLSSVFMVSNIVFAEPITFYKNDKEWKLGFYKNVSSYKEEEKEKINTYFDNEIKI